MSYDLFSIHDYSTCFMIKIKCANDTIIELHDLHKSFDSSIVCLTEVQHHACALNIPICPTGTMMVSPGGLSGTLHCFRQLPGTPGEANESAPGLEISLLAISGRIIQAQCCWKRG